MLSSACLHAFFVQELVAECIWLLFPGSHRSVQVADPSSGRGKEAHDACLASLAAVLPCISQWWARFCLKADEDRESKSLTPPAAGSRRNDGGIECGGVSLARAVASAYAAAVETRTQYPFERQRGPPALGVVAARGSVYNGTSRHSVLRDGDTMRGGGESPAGVTPGRKQRSLRTRTSAPHARATPRRFGEAVAALSTVPFLQPQLIRALRAVLRRFSRTPVRVLHSGQLAGWSSGGQAALSSSTESESRKKTKDGSLGSYEHGQGEMAPPPPRAPPGKKRRVSLDLASLRDAAAGGDSDGDREDRAAAAGRDGEGEGSGGQMSAAADLFAGPERLPSFSGDSIACDAVDVVLSRACAALDFFENNSGGSRAKDAVGEFDGVDNSALSDGKAEESVPGEDGSCYETNSVYTLLKHTAAITCAIRALAPFLDSAEISARCGEDPRETPRAEGKRRWNRDPTATHAAQASRGHEVGSSKVSTEMPPVFGRLADGLEAAVQAAARYDADGTYRECRTGGNTNDSKILSSPTVVGPTAVKWLWDMLVTCAGALPMSVLVLRQNRPDSNGGSVCDDDVTKRDQSFLSCLAATVKLAAEKALEVILAPDSVVLAATLEVNDLPAAASTVAGAVAGQSRGKRELSLWTPELCWPHDGSAASVFAAERGRLGPGANAATVLSSATLEAPFLLKCFLLAAATAAQGWVGAGADPEDSQKDEATDRRARHVGAGRGRARSAGTNGERRVGGSRSDIDAEDAPCNAQGYFMAGLRHDSPLVRQSAIAALPVLLQNASVGDNGEGPCTSAERSDAGRWQQRWLPALLSLVTNVGSCEAVRLELAAALPRLGASLFHARRRQQEHPQRPLPQPPAILSHSDTCNQARREAEYPLGPDTFTDILPLWPPLLKDESAAVRAAAARGVLAAAAAAPLAELRATGAPGARVLRCLTDMLACGEPEVAWVVAGGAGQFVADGGKMLRALYSGGGGKSTATEDRNEGYDGEETYDSEEDDEEDTLGEEEVRERERRARERAVDRFIEAVGALLKEHGDRLRLGRWQSLHEFTALLRAIG